MDAYNEGPMVKIKTKIIIIIAISAIVTIIAGLFLFGFLLKITSDINYLPKGQYLFSSKSPQGSFTIDVFLCDGGATTDYGIRCSVTDQIGQTRNIYWNYHEKEAIIVWTDDNTVIINNHSIDVRSQKYDYRVD